MSDYQYDVFLSWRRADPVQAWFRRYFRPEFEARLASSLGQQPRVFCDERDVHGGEAWPEVIRAGLQASRLLVPVWEPQYFRSGWCRSELASMYAREERLGFRTAVNPHGLVIPLVVRDGQHFQDHLDRVQADRLPEVCLTDAPALRYSTAYIDGFLPAIHALVANVERALDHVPAWAPDFPYVEEADQVQAAFGLPTFSPPARPQGGPDA